jgi:hypothetical protein
MEKDIVQMSQKELGRVHIIHKVLDGSLTQRAAGERLELSERQIRRIAERVKTDGDKGFIHRLRSRESKRRIPGKQWQKILKLYRTVYYDFGPTFACEKLLERNGIKISDESLRNKLLAEGLWHKCRKSRKHRHWRERKHYLGEMLQMDGSHHAWFETRGGISVLMGYIDDSTGEKSGMFFEYEGTLPAFASLKEYIEKHGIPQSIYVDRHSTYKGKAKQTVDDELNNRLNLSQFERACKELGIKVIHAHSPQAKGRIERSFKTDQDRLVKELRLAGISTIKEANKFLENYWPKHNKRFAVEPAQTADMHKPVPTDVDLDAILCIKTERVVRNDFTIVYQGQLYQILDKNCPRTAVVEERIDGRKLISGNGRYLSYKPIAVKPVNKIEQKQVKMTWRPPMEHPWKKPSYEQRTMGLKQEALAAL